MTWLALDTSGPRASVAAGAPGAEPARGSVEGSRVHASRLLPLVDEVLARARMRLLDVTDLALTDGPGSFTGLRVAATVAKALARTRGVRVHTAPALLASAAFHLERAGGAPVLSLSDALRGEVYAGAWTLVGGRVRAVLAPRAVRPAELPSLLERPVVALGRLPAALAAELESWCGAVDEPADGAMGLFRLAALGGGLSPVDDLESWEPDYGRPAEAQARWEAAHGRALPDPARHS
ncbi:MAG: tRNA (adenosine(37)-N6)-threonylcarbamoyltransferase complex dimerization subunit type 1 TsaB [Gemmatimonadales bacterium]